MVLGPLVRRLMFFSVPEEAGRYRPDSTCRSDAGRILANEPRPPQLKNAKSAERTISPSEGLSAMESNVFCHEIAHIEGWVHKR
jgi:hypothetical protein